MTPQCGPAPLSRAQGEMCTQVDALLQRHRSLLPLQQAGWSFELDCDDDAIWVAAAPPGGGAAVSARHEAPRWWLPPRSGRALAITADLVTSLLADLDTGR